MYTKEMMDAAVQEAARIGAEAGYQRGLEAARYGLSKPFCETAMETVGTVTTGAAIGCITAWGFSKLFGD